MKYSFLIILSIIVMFSACNSAPDPTVATLAAAKSLPMPTLVDQPNDKLTVQSVTFPSKDGLTIHARIYNKNKALPIILLCHQAGSSKDEYAETAQMLADWGFNCVAIDQRAGGTRLGGNNETATLAESQGKSVEFADAEQDIEAAINYAFKLYDKPIILVGSSYSASLALKIGVTNRKLLAIAAFSPGEYFKTDPQLIGKAIVELKRPTFITSSQEEIPQTEALFNLVGASSKIQFKPTTAGIHGARALWQQTPDHESYRKAFKAFLDGIK